ncbi:alpha/beta hydrolase [uncultured Aquimarina sp.]|uniref:alpha/beta fold hydrolase n=1 Tax=uncultured Aquimarina sp. TaxID=575652 RepID=UPI00262F36BD|nr:alpha/beta hydrolase [uncultured Aquimarina sp.]
MNNTFFVEHEKRGKYIQLSNTKAFVFDKGEGVPIVFFHGVPASSFLYRKIINTIANHGVRGVSFDLLGMGLSDRPLDYDYSWTGLGNWSVEVIEKLKLKKFHVVLHDIGGPVGSEVISKMQDRILSVTILNTLLVNLPQFRKPFPMGFFPILGVGELFIATTTPFLLQKLMHLRGVYRKEAFGIEVAKTYLQFLKGKDKARSFLKIMRSFEPTSEKENLYISSLKNLDVPKQLIWGMNDKGLTYEKYGVPIKKALEIEKITKTEGSHFLQEDFSEIIAAKLLELVQQA